VITFSSFHWVLKSKSQNGLFQCTLFVEIRTLVSWFKSILKLLKIKCFDTHISMKTFCLQKNKTQHYLGKENAWGAGGVGERVGVN